MYHLHALIRNTPRTRPHTWHDLAIREVAREKVVVGSDILVAHCILLWLQLNDPVYKQEWESADPIVLRPVDKCSVLCAAKEHLRACEGGSSVSAQCLVWLRRSCPISLHQSLPHWRPLSLQAQQPAQAWICGVKGVLTCPGFAGARETDGAGSPADTYCRAAEV